MKKYVTFISVFVLLLVLYWGFLKLIYINSDFSCGRIIDQEEIRGTNYYIYKFNIGKEEYTGHVAISNNISLYELKKMDCVKIRYSKWISSYNRIEDSRIKNRE